MLRHIRRIPIALATRFLAGWLTDQGSYEPPSQPPGGASGGQKDEASSLAVVTLILGIGAWTILPIIGAYAGALIGWIELQNIKKGKSSEAGKTITQIGFWLSVVQVVLSILGTCVAMALMLFVFGSFGALMAAAGL